MSLRESYETDSDFNDKLREALDAQQLQLRSTDPKLEAMEAMLAMLNDIRITLSGIQILLKYRM